MPSGEWIVRQTGHVASLLKLSRLVGLNNAAKLIKGDIDADPNSEILCDLNRYSCFGGRLYVSGRIQSDSLQVIGLGIRLPHRRWGWVEAFLEPSGSAETSVCGGTFNFSVPAPEGPEALDWKLRAALADGSWFDLSDAYYRALTNNPFDQMLSDFMVRLSGRPSGTIVEIGSRARSGRTYIDTLPGEWKYVGFDIADGPNVDVVGDAHEMSRYLEEASVDAILSISTFEHLAMPWKVVLEMNRVLKLGGVVCIASHQTWPLHDEPWDYWRFSGTCWKAMFNEVTGFRIDKVGLGQGADVVAKIMNDATAGLPGQPAFLGSSVLVTKIADTRLSWPVPTHVVTEGEYPG